MSREQKINKVLSLLAEQDRSMAWLAKSIGASRQSVQTWLNGESAPRKTAVYDSMLSALEGSAARDMFVRGPGTRKPSPSSRKRASSIYCGTAPIPYAGEIPNKVEFVEPLELNEHFEVDFQFILPGCFAAKIVGNSCHPLLLPGDVTVWCMDDSPSYGLVVLSTSRNKKGCIISEFALDDDHENPKFLPLNITSNSQAGLKIHIPVARLVAVQRKVDGLRRTWFLETGLRIQHLSQ